MKTFNNMAAQGDLLIIRINNIPDNVSKINPEKNKYIVAHSETGHHHTIEDKNIELFQAANDNMIMYLVVNDECNLIHNRSFDTHEAIKISKGTYEIRKQREHTIDGWRKVLD